MKEMKTASMGISTADGLNEIPNDFVIICAEGLLPTPFLHRAGIEVEAKLGTA